MGFILFMVFLAVLVGGILLCFKVTQKETEDRYGGKKKSADLGFSFRGVPLIVVACAVFFLWLSFTTVDSQNRSVVTRFGNVNRTLQPGAHLVIPFIENVYPITVQTLVVKPDEDSASHDMQIVHTQVTLAYHFDPDWVAWLFIHLFDSSNNSAENKVIVPSILEAIKATTAQYDAQDLISKRPQVRDGIEAFVKDRLMAYHIVSESTSITDFRFSKTYDEAIELKVTAQQKALKAENDLQRIKIEAQQQVAQAEGEAAALKAQKEQITPELLQLRTIEMMKDKWDGKLPETIVGGSSALPMMDVLKGVQKAK